jgi:hypothetical protein
MTTTDSKIAKLQTDFQALSEIASELNVASDSLTKTVGVLDEALKKLNVGLTVWVSFVDRGDDDNPHLYNLDQIGYCKVDGKWGLSIRRIWGDQLTDDKNEDGPWLFNDASREMRLRSVDKIPEVITKLAKEAFDTTKRIQEKTKEVLDLAKAITQVAKAEKGKPPTFEEQIAAGQSALEAAEKVKGLPVLGRPTYVTTVGTLSNKRRK